MAENPDYKELLQLLNEFEVEYLIVGGFAVMKYGEPRYTKDLDLWIHNSLQNSIRVIGALKKFGAPLDNDGITPETFSEKQVVYQIGIAPVRIDILTAITGVEFADAWKNKVPGILQGAVLYSRDITLKIVLRLRSSTSSKVELRSLKQTSFIIHYPT